MKQHVTGGLPPPGQPFSWAIRARDMLYATHGPVQDDGTILLGSIEEQAELTIANLQKTLTEVGGRLDQVVQVQIFLLDVADMAPVDRVYARFFAPPYPNRASLVVAGLVAPGMRIEMTATADLTL
ncbi:RidA family protein [Amorphus sp. MBR-141]